MMYQRQAIPSWAAVDEATFQHRDGQEWSAETEFGPRCIWFCERNAYGVLDHAVYKVMSRW